MATMQAYQIDAIGNPTEQLKLRTVPKPTIQSDTEVLVKVKAATVNPADFLFITGNYRAKPQIPKAPVGFEGAGDVEEVGKAATNYKPGQRVHFYSPTAGAWAEYVLIDTKVVPPVPIGDISYEEAAQLTVNPVTALAMISTTGAQKDDFLVQTAASSALGRILIQLAKKKGIKTINVVRRNEHKKPLEELGADVVINSEEVSDLTQAIIDALPEADRKQGGAKFAVDAVAGKTGTDVAKALRPNGTIYVYGALSGKPLELDAITLIFKQPVVTGFWLAPWMQQNLDQARNAFGEIIGYISKKELQLPFHTFEGKTQIQDAIKHANEPGKAEKTILHF